jgi:hypothetical protein
MVDIWLPDLDSPCCRGALTEAQLQQELGLSEQAPVAPRRASNTIAWWQERSVSEEGY